MAKINKSSKNKRNKKNKEEKYNADNEIIIGVSTAPKEVRVEKKKSTRTKQVENSSNRTSNYKNSRKMKKKKINNEKHKKNLTKEQEIKKSNRKKLIASCCILLMIIIAITIYLFTTPMFNITNIEITGNEKNSIETYISLTRIDLNNTNIFATTKNKIIKNVKENSYVEEVEVKRKLPNTIQINIIERKPVYEVQYGEGYIYLDKQGYVLEINEASKDLIKLVGLESTKEVLTEGNRLIKEDLLKLDTVLKIVNYCNYNTIENKITSMNVADTSNYIIYFEKQGQTAYLGNETKLNEKILRLKEVLDREKGNKGEIFVTENNVNANRVYFKPLTKK